MTSATTKPRAGEHTKGPWRYSVNVGPTKGLLIEEDGSTILELANSTRSSRFERDIQRIVACVNACEGLPLEELEKFAKHAPYTSYAELQAERDLLRERERELVEEIAVIANSKWTNFEDASEFREWVLNRCRSALAKHGR